jgi:hypothetical protein
MTHKYAPRCAYILFHKTFFNFKRFLTIRLSKDVFIFLLDFLLCSSGNFLLGDLKKEEETFLNFAYLKVSFFIEQTKLT